MSRSTHGKLAIPWLYVLLGGALVVALAALSARGAAQENQRPAPPAKAVVAVVDMGRVLAESKEWQNAVEERARMLDTTKRTLSKLMRKDQVLRNEYESLPPGSEERQNKATEIEAAVQEYQQTRQELDEKMARQHEESVRRLFGKLTRVVSSYAKEHGIQVVLKKQEFQPAEPGSVEQSLQIATTEVLYADPALDISDAVVERLNAESAGPIEVK